MEAVPPARAPSELGRTNSSKESRAGIEELPAANELRRAQSASHHPFMLGIKNQVGAEPAAPQSVPQRLDDRWDS